MLRAEFGHSQLMKSRNCIVALLILVSAIQAQPIFAAAPAAADAAFAGYVRTIEARLAQQHSSSREFVVSPPCPEMTSSGRTCIERVAVNSLPGALLHHWRATQFVAGTKATDLDRLLGSIQAYPSIFAPQVETASVQPSSTDHLRISMRVRQHHVLTVVLDSNYDVAFAQLDSQHRYSISRSTRIREVDLPGTPQEHPLSEGEEHGFLWHQNTYWSYEERDGGLYVQVESLSLTRSVPLGLGWAIGPYIESIPRDSLTFTLRCVAAALHKSSTSIENRTHQ